MKRKEIKPELGDMKKPEIEDIKPLGLFSKAA